MNRYSILLALAFAVGCQGAEESPTPPQAPEESSAQRTYVAGPEHDLEVISKNAILGFRPAPSGFVTGYTTHDVNVIDGRIAFVPHHYTAAGRKTGGSIELQTTTSYRGDEPLSTTVVSASVNPKGVLELTREDMIETITNREDGIEQAWHFATMPLGEGDFRVEVTVGKQTYLSTTDRGLHFRSPVGLGVRYSHAMWIDAAGTETAIPVAFENNRIVMSVPSDVIATSVYPAVLDPTVTGEENIDVPVNGSTGANATQPAVAFDGTNYLVVWADRRLSSDDDIFGTRVSPAGAILNANGILISAGPGRQSNPTVAFAGTQYIVAWEDFKVAGGSEADIAAARVSTGGTVTSLGVVASTGTSETQPSVAGLGAGALLSWNANGDVRGAVFSGAFGAPFDISAQAGIDETDPAVAAQSGGSYLVAWSEGATATADLRGVLVSSAGVVAGPFAISAGGGRQFEPAATFDGTNFAVTWTNNNAGINIFGARVTPSGIVLDTHLEGAVTVGGITVSGAANNQQRSAISCTTLGCLVTWDDRRNFTTNGFDVMGQLLTSTFTLNGGEFAVANSLQDQRFPASGTNGTDFFVAQADSRLGVPQDTVMGTRVTASGLVQDPNGISLPTGNNREVNPEVGVSGTTTALVWTDSRQVGVDIQLVRYSGANGNTKLDTTARVVSNGANAQSTPAVTVGTSGNMYVAWSDHRNGLNADIFGTRVDINGNALDSAGVAISTAVGDQLRPDVAVDNSGNFLVVWDDRRGTGFDIFGALVSAAGTVVVSDIVICNVTGDQTRPQVVFDTTAGQFVVVWTDGRSAGDSNIFGARIDVAGNVLDTNGVAVSSATGGQFRPKIAFTGGRSLVVWEDRRTDDGDIFATRITAGTSISVLDPAGISIGVAADRQFDAAVSATGGTNGGWILAWTDSRNLATTSTDIFGAQVSLSGVASANFAISTNVEEEGQPTMGGFNPAKTVRVAYEKRRTDLQAVRIVTRQLRVSGDLGSACSGSTQCESGFCIDGRCCESECGGNNLSDCQACRLALTGQPDGVCAPRPTTAICRNYATVFCDLRELCDGVNVDCPPDVGRNEGLVCNSTTGTVCPANDTSGAPHACP